MMPCAFSGLVYDVGGRTVAVQPDTHIVEPMLDWVTSGLYEPGVQLESGRAGGACEQVLASAPPR